MRHYTSATGRRIVGLALGSTAWLDAWPAIVEDLNRAAKGEFVVRKVTLPVRGASILLTVLLERCGTQGNLQLSALPASSIGG
jgi:tetrahydromethanopterin S-methyltransferase subunit E